MVDEDFESNQMLKCIQHCCARLFTDTVVMVLAASNLNDAAALT